MYTGGKHGGTLSTRGIHADVIVSLAFSVHIHRLVVSKEAKPLVDLAWPEFLKAVLDLSLRHYQLWTNADVSHGDISLANAMYTIERGDTKMGILSDWDTATACSHSEGPERVGTLPFMAIHTLYEDVHSRPYSYDLEALAWVIIWLCHCKDTFTTWTSPDYNQCRIEKLDYLRVGFKKRAGTKEGWMASRWVILALRKWLTDVIRDQIYEWDLKVALLQSQLPVHDMPQKSPQEVWAAFCESLRSILPYLIRCDYYETAKVLGDFLDEAHLM